MVALLIDEHLTRRLDAEFLLQRLRDGRLPLPGHSYYLRIICTTRHRWLYPRNHVLLKVSALCAGDDLSRRELPRPTVFGPTRPSLVEVGVLWFCVGACIRRGHSVHETQASRATHQNTKRSEDGSRLRRRLPFTGGSECPTPTESTLDHNRRCTLFIIVRGRRSFVMLPESIGF